MARDLRDKYLGRAEKSVERMIKMVNELDTIIKLDTGGISLVLVKINLTKVCLDVIESQEFRAKKKEMSPEKGRLTVQVRRRTSGSSVPSLCIFSRSAQGISAW